MTKKLIEIASPRTAYSLSELSEEEIVSLLEDFPPDPETLTCPEDEPLPTIGEISQRESELFTEIAANLAGDPMSYGHAVLLLAIYAITIEDRVRVTLLS